MIARIADEINRDDLTNQIKREIQSAIQYYHRHIFYFTQERVSRNTVANQEWYAVPDNFLFFIGSEPIVVVDTDGTIREMNEVSYDWIQRRQTGDDTGIPRRYALWEDQLRLHFIPDDVYELQLSYVKKLATLSADGDTNAWMTDGEELIRSRAKMKLYRSVIRNSERALESAADEQDALRGLRDMTANRQSTGEIQRHL